LAFKEAYGFRTGVSIPGLEGAFDLMATRGSRQLGVQVKRSPLPLRFHRHEWVRMEAEGARLNWRWVVAAVNPDGIIMMLDPALARVKKETVFHPDAKISNLPKWLDLGKEATERGVGGKG
jgi:hypothetical protein